MAKLLLNSNGKVLMDENGKVYKAPALGGPRIALANKMALL